MRSDLPLGFLTAQIVHAAGETATANLPPDTNAVVLAVPDESRLREIAAALSVAGVSHRLIQEPDAPWLGQATAIGIVPGPRSRKLPIIPSLPLLRSLGVVAQSQSAGAKAPEMVAHAHSTPLHP